MAQYNVVHLDSVLCGTRGLSPTGLSSQPVISVTNSPVNSSPNRNFLSERQGYEEIYGVRWYYLLVPNKESVSLMSEVSDIKSKFLVCLNYPITPYTTRRGKIKDTRRLFAAFEHPTDFWMFANKIPKERWHFFEVIFGDRSQKIYFDIDIHVPNTNEDFVARLINCLVGRIVDFFARKQYAFDLSRNLLWFHSNSETCPEKRSYHLIIDGYAVSNCKETESVVNEILDGCPDEFRQYIDSSMYSSKQQFRLYQSRKARTDRPKTFIKSWKFGLKTINYEFPDLPGCSESQKEMLQENTLFGTSCVTQIDRCYIMPVHCHFENRKLHQSTPDADDFLSEQITDQVVQEMIRRIDPVVFKIYDYPKNAGTMMRLIRIAPAVCSLCTPEGGPDRVHESENAFLRINSTGNVYFYCFRNENVSKWVANIGDLLQLEDDVFEQQSQELGKKLVKQDIDFEGLGRFFGNKDGRKILSIPITKTVNSDRANLITKSTGLSSVVSLSPISSERSQSILSPERPQPILSPERQQSSLLPSILSSSKSETISLLNISKGAPPGIPIISLPSSNYPIWPNPNLNSSEIPKVLLSAPISQNPPGMVIQNPGTMSQPSSSVPLNINNLPPGVINLKSLNIQGKKPPILITAPNQNGPPQLNSLHHQMHELAGTSKKSKLIFKSQTSTY